MEGRGVKTKGLGLGKPRGGSFAGGVISMLGMGMLTNSAMNAVGMGDAGAIEHYAAQEAVETAMQGLGNSKAGQAAIGTGKEALKTAGKYVPNVIKNIPGQASRLGTTALTKAGSYIPNVLKGGSTLGRVGSSALTTAGKLGSSALTTAGKAGSALIKPSSFGSAAMKGLGAGMAIGTAAWGGFDGYNQAEAAGRSKAGGTALGILTGSATVEKDERGRVKNEGATLANAAIRGAGMGAAAGSFVPVVGTAVGAVVGAGIGTAAELWKQETDPFGEAAENGSYITGKKGRVQEKTERMQKVKAASSGNNLDIREQTRASTSARLKLEMKDSKTTDARKKQITDQLEDNRKLGQTQRDEGTWWGSNQKTESKDYMAEEQRLMNLDPLEKARQDKAAQEAPYGQVALSKYEQDNAVQISEEGSGKNALDAAAIQAQQQTEERGSQLRTNQGLVDQRNTASDDFEGQQTGLSGSERSRAQEHARLADELDVARSGGNEMEISKAQQQFDSSAQRGQTLKQETADAKAQSESYLPEWMFGKQKAAPVQAGESDSFKNEVQAERERRRGGESLNNLARLEYDMNDAAPDAYASMNGSDAALGNLYGPAPGTENMHRSTTPAEAAQITAQLPLAANSVSKGGGVVEQAPLPIDKMESGLTNSFDAFVGKLEKINLPKIPDTVTMQGQHQVNVTINGADVLKNMGPEIQAMIATQIAMATRDLNKATEGGLT